MINNYMSHQQESGCLIITVKDRFDENNCFQIQDSILDLLDEKPAHLLLDLNEVNMIRSSGLRVILSLAKGFQAKDKHFTLVYLKNEENRQVSQILEISGFTKIVSVCPTKDSAIKHCSKPID